MNEIQPILDWIVGKWPWVAGVMASARIFAKPISGLLQSGLTKLALYALATPEQDDDLWVKRIVTNKTYRFVAFLLDWILSIKLPTESSLAAVLAEEAALSKPAPPSFPPVGLWLLCAALLCGGCVTPDRLEQGGAYAASETQAAQPELYAIDASFEMAYSALDATFKYERDNRLLLWKLSPGIKKGLDQLRKEAGIVRDDYALARTIYLENPTPAGLDELRTQLSKLNNANSAALAVIQKKGLQ